MAERSRWRRAGTWALILAAVLCCAGVFQHGLWTPDEPREAEVGREMLDAGFSAMPTLGHESFLEKPPLFAWITAASYALFGVSGGAARLPAVLFAIGSILVAYQLGRRAAGRLAGLCSAIVLATMWQFAETTHKAVLDTALTFFVAAGHLAFLRLWRAPGPCQRPVYVAIGVLSGLAFLTKSWIGPGLLCAPPILAAAAIARWDYVKRVLPRAFIASVLGVAVFGLPWVLALAHTPGGGWDAVKTCLVTNTIGRSVGGSTEEFGFSGHSHSPVYYLTAFLVVTAPWTMTLPAAIRAGTLSRTRHGGRALFCGMIFVAGLLLLSVPAGKREIYLLPLLPAAAVVPGVWLSRVDTRAGGAWDRATRITLRVFAAGALFVTVGTMVGSAIWIPHSAGYASDFSKTIVLHLAAVVVPVLVAAFWLRRRLVPSAARGLRTSLLLWTFYVVYHAAALPLLDPARDMSEGSRQVAAAVPADEKLLGWSLDETTIAAVPFYSGRILANLDDQGAVLREIDSGAAKHLVVMDKDVKKMSRALASRLSDPRSIRVSATRAVNVYAVSR